jgi:hypothetical protein
MAERTEGSISIQAPAATIMGVIADFESYPEWSDIKKVEVRTKGPDGRAEQVYYEITAGPFSAAYTLLYTYAPDDAGCSWTYVEGTGALKDMEGEYVLEPAGDGTNVTYRMSAELNIPGPGFLKRNLMAQGERVIIDTALKGLKKRVEGL